MSAYDARVVDKVVDAARDPLDGLDSSADRVFVEDVERQDVHIVVLSGELGQGRRRCGRASRVERWNHRWGYTRISRVMISDLQARILNEYLPCSVMFLTESTYGCKARSG